MQIANRMRFLRGRWLGIAAGITVLCCAAVVLTNVFATPGPTTSSSVSGTKAQTEVEGGGAVGQSVADTTAGGAPEITTSAESIAILPFGKSAYDIVTADGGVFSFGGAPFYGSASTLHLAEPIVAAAETPDGGGYWLVGADGGIFSYGDAKFYGSLGGHPLTAPVTGIAAAPGGQGYWLVARDGGVFAFGSAGYFGSMGGKSLDAPVVAMAATPSGNGYWMVGTDGGVFAFGGASYQGSMGGQHLNSPVINITSSHSGNGYMMVGYDGGTFAFGDAAFYGSMALSKLSAPVLDTAVTSDGGGYWMMGADGAIYSFGDAVFAGRTLSPFLPPLAPAVVYPSKVAATPTPVSTGSSASSAANGPVGGPGGTWHLTFDSEFTGSTINSAQWNQCLAWGCTNAGPAGSPELETYVPANCQMGSGYLSMVAAVGGGGARPYSSCALNTLGKYNFTYGYAESREWLPAGSGFWPAFWLLDAGGSIDEIDAMEADGATPSQAILTYHYGSGQASGSTINGPNYTAGWHTFAVDWEPGSITWYVDGVAEKTFTGSEVDANPMYLILNLAVSGQSSWHSTVTPQTPFPSDQKVAYVRVWQR